MSPTLILALVALPPSVSCKDAEKKKKKIPVRKVWSLCTQINAIHIAFKFKQLCLCVVEGAKEC